MDYKTNWKDFLKYDQHGRRVHDFPSYVVDTAPGEKNYMYHGEYEAMIAAEEAAKAARRAARQAELAVSRPDSLNSAVTRTNAGSDPAESAAVFAGRRGDPRLSPPPDLERHSRKCAICSHPDRDAIEGEFIRWRSPHKIARDYDLSDRATVYRHAHATNLFEERRRQIARVLESYLETIDDDPPADFDPVTRAVRVYAHLNAHGAWFEPLRKVHITTSHVLSPNPEPEPGLELEIDADAQPDSTQGSSGGRSFSSDINRAGKSCTSGEPSPRPQDDSWNFTEPNQDSVSNTQDFSQVPAGTTEGSPARERRESAREVNISASAQTSGASSSAALHAQASKNGFHGSPATAPRPNRNNSELKIAPIDAKQTTSQNLTAAKDPDSGGR